MMRTILFLVILSFWSCTDKGAPPSGDTRPLVQEAIKRIDPLKTPAYLNKVRAALYEQKVKAEPDSIKRLDLVLQWASELLKCGQTLEALQKYNEAIDFITRHGLAMDAENKRKLFSQIGIAFMRHGEIENCLLNHQHESCILPIQGNGIHVLPFGSSNAIQYYQSSLAEFPDDLETRYLLNLAYMTLGQYPEQVPEAFRLPIAWFTSEVKLPSYPDIAAQVGLNRRSHAGGVVLDDFTNDGWLDVVITSWTADEELQFFVNNGDGTFTDQTETYGLRGQVGILQLNQTDYNNDGWLDLYLMRGAWLGSEGAIPNTLLMNTGKGGFVDVTLAAGLNHPAPRQAAAWADFNLDGWLDLVLANESMPGHPFGIDLYINRQNGTFEESSKAYGLTENAFFKGVTVADVNNDRLPDLYFSPFDSENLLYILHNRDGKQVFEKVNVGVGDPKFSFPCWSFDYNNDGWEDLFISGYSNDMAAVEHFLNSKLGHANPDLLPRLYQNHGNLHFENVAQSLGITEVSFTMGCNFGDINTDGYLDFFLGTGNPLYQSLVPNKLYLNMKAKRFADVSYNGFSNIQKGHGVSFGDLDQDGDEDLYVVIGGAYDGDNYYNSLFENPNADHHHWVVLRLEGKKANRPAIGARVKVVVTENGQAREIHRTVSSGASFGANSLQLEIGLGQASAIQKIQVQWPCADCPDQVFDAIKPDKAYKLTQDNSTAQELPYHAVKMGRDNSPPTTESHHQ